MVRTKTATSTRVTYGRSILACGLMVLLTFSGCSFRAWTVFPTLGIRPDKPGTDYSEDVQKHCQRYAGSQIPSLACLDYFNVWEWGTDLSQAYRSRARMNEWAFATAGILGLAAIGALTGLAAFGSAGSDAAKIIPLAGGFTAGSIAYFNNKQRAKEYTRAANDIDEAVDLAQRRLDNSDAAFTKARNFLSCKVTEIQNDVEKKRIELYEDEKKVEEVVRQTIDRLRKEGQLRPVDPRASGTAQGGTPPFRCDSLLP